MSFITVESLPPPPPPRPLPTRGSQHGSCIFLVSYNLEQSPCFYFPFHNVASVEELINVLRILFLVIKFKMNILAWYLTSNIVFFHAPL